MKKHTTSAAIPMDALKAEALASMSASFESFCLAAGLETLSEMLEQDATAACGERHERGERRQEFRSVRQHGVHDDGADVNGTAIFLKSGAAKFPILAGWRSARGVIGASVFWRTATTLQG